jgi:ATP-dependent DNA ligase
MKYESFKKNGFIFPPRAEYKCPAAELDKYDDGTYFGQPKYNGMALMVFTNGDELHLYNRHKEYMPLVTKNSEVDFRGLAQSKNWYVYAGEYLNKSKYGETGIKEKDKFVIWDDLVWDGQYLVGSTYTERLDLLENIYPCNRAIVTDKNMEVYDHLCCTNLNRVYKAPTYIGKFAELYQQIVKTDLYEGLVLKKKDSKLEFGLQELNNHSWQIKCRKQTLNYAF